MQAQYYNQSMLQSQGGGTTVQTMPLFGEYDQLSPPLRHHGVQENVQQQPIMMLQDVTRLPAQSDMTDLMATTAPRRALYKFSCRDDDSATEPPTGTSAAYPLANPGSPITQTLHTKPKCGTGIILLTRDRNHSSMKTRNHFQPIYYDFLLTSDVAARILSRHLLPIPFVGSLVLQITKSRSPDGNHTTHFLDARSASVTLGYTVDRTQNTAPRQRQKDFHCHKFSIMRILLMMLMMV